MLHRIGPPQPHQILIRGGGGEVLLEIGGGEVGADQPVLGAGSGWPLRWSSRLWKSRAPRLDIEGDRRLAARLLGGQQQHIGTMPAAAGGDLLGDIADLEQGAFGLEAGNVAARPADAAKHALVGELAQGPRWAVMWLTPSVRVSSFSEGTWAPSANSPEPICSRMWRLTRR